MADNTAIEWADATWNPIVGCSVVSPGCTNCYAMRLAGTRLRNHPSRAGLTQDSKAGPVWNGEVRLYDPVFDQPLRWRRPRRIFVCAHGDLFHEAVPNEWIGPVFAVMALAPRHTFLVLTKRAKRMREYLLDSARVRLVYTAAAKLRVVASPDPDKRTKQFHAWMSASAKDTAWLSEGGAAAILFGQNEPGRDYPSWVRWPLPNVWLGVSVEDQARADESRDDLAALAAAGWRTFVSYEPALGPVDWRSWEFLSWLISGGESGPRARPSHPDWHRAARDFCAQNGIPYFFKQWGEWTPTPEIDDDSYPAFRARGGRDQFTFRDFTSMDLVGKSRAGRLLDGREHSEFPAAR